ncbi:hypothetical protein ASG73_15110 [Janibacter sp. Soil728]|uniref:hypothetical protein n=1 Tax=Janibacter sp. Soil728 TaxID=1736393 RepID=UPI0006F8C15B|nr:hypothetical protein [Janibacter sp. Soil728]KRE35988.1 hypothetical protein ASG73_15110 [Janibacter sp. Soil728]
MDNDPFEVVRRESDPLQQARLAGDLMSLYRQRGYELARIRRDAINRVVEQRGGTFSAVGAELGLTRGRISQIRKDAPATERAFFGVGPIEVATPTRHSSDRPEGVVALEDAESARIISDVLRDLAFEVRPVAIPIDGAWSPAHEAVVICGPKSSQVSAEILSHDPVLAFHEVERDQWVIEDRKTGQRFESPLDDGKKGEDVAYVGRVTREGKTVLVIAGVHALGSVGAATYLAENLEALHDAVGGNDFSMVIRSQFDGLTPTTKEAAWGPVAHR